MKNTRKCPKCQSADIIRIPGKRAPGGAGNLIQVGWNLFSTVKPVRYACATCGFTEDWLDSGDDIARVKAYYRA
jgi:predicted nucleic-acid-binding Zn-ribbon protein